MFNDYIKLVRKLSEKIPCFPYNYYNLFESENPDYYKLFNVLDEYLDYLSSIDDHFSNTIRNIIKHKNILNKHDLKQLDLAIENDIYALIDNSVVLSESINYELELQKFLDKHNILYKTQDQLVEEQTQKYGRPISTPDFLIKSDLYINNIKINWIDAKNYYGANISFIKYSINKQILKYNKNYGNGCIIFKLGFNDELNFNNTLLLDNDSLDF
jgi:hypothetical protein